MELQSHKTSNISQKSDIKTKYFVVKEGNKPGIYTNGDEYVKNLGNKLKVRGDIFFSLEEAERWFNESREDEYKRKKYAYTLNKTGDPIVASIICWVESTSAFKKAKEFINSFYKS